VELLGTARIGQITGTTDLDRPEPEQKWPLLVDAEQWPLLTDTGRWGAVGLDLGANTEHEGRLYIFFGDVWPGQSGIPINADLVAWVDEPEVLRRGGHLALGWKFVLPFEPTSQQGQRDWRFCGKCGALFYDGYPTFKGVCHRGGVHEAIGWRFVVPARETGAQAGQPAWRYCGKCASLFYDGYPDFKGVCPQGGSHQAIGWEFLMLHEPTGVQGQPEWRYCGRCAGLFWDGGAHKGLCRGAPGGGVHLNAVVRPDGRFDHFTATDPVGETLSLETPNGAFSYAGRVWVFAGFGDAKYTQHRRPGDPIPGCYLTSKQRPDLPGLYTTEFLFSPRIGCCPRDAARDRLESHAPLGFKFLLSHSIPEGPNRQANYRFCVKCASLFWNGDAGFSSRCYRSGSHEAAGLDYVLLHSVAEDAQHQANWRRCAKCASVFWNGDPANSGLCPAGGLHQATPLNLVLAHPSLEEDGTQQANWRYCGKCFGVFFDGYGEKGVCPKDGAGHSASGFNFLLPHDVDENPERQRNWRYCGKCFGLVYDGYVEKGACPKDGGGHSAIGYNFVLPHDAGETVDRQRDWRYCGKCFGLFYDGYVEKGVCPKDGGGHSAIGYNFVLPHNPGEDALTQGGWRFCTKCHGAVWTGQEDLFSWVAPCVVQNARHPGLPQTPHQLGLVMLGFHYSSNPGIRVAWMPLKTPAAPMLQDIRYYTGNAANPWSPLAEAAAVILPHANTYTHLSAAWLEGPQRWILLYSHANDETGPDGFLRAAVARIGKTLWDWSDEKEIFNPIAQGAYGRYMHKVGSPYHINPDIPPSQDPAKPEHDGWAYGAFLLNRYTEWDATTRELGIYYLLSLSSPYQVQLMHSRLRLD
jgi:hypothetical protein